MPMCRCLLVVARQPVHHFALFLPEQFVSEQVIHVHDLDKRTHRQRVEVVVFANQYLGSRCVLTRIQFMALFYEGQVSVICDGFMR